MTFNERLTAIGGSWTRKLEVYKGGIWNDQAIPEVPEVGNNKYGSLSCFTSLVIKNQLHVFGNISIFNQDKNF